VRPHYKLVKTMKDEFISFEKTNHNNPYDNPHLLKAEDILGYMLSYKRPFSEGDRFYLLRVKKKLHKEVCLNCIRYPDNSIEQMAQGRRPIVKYKVLDVEKSKEQHKPVFKEVERKSWLTCDGCRVLKCKQAFNREIKCVLEVRFKLS